MQMFFLCVFLMFSSPFFCATGCFLTNDDVLRVLRASDDFYGLAPKEVSAITLRFVDSCQKVCGATWDAPKYQRGDAVWQAFWGTLSECCRFEKKPVRCTALEDFVFECRRGANREFLANIEGVDPLECFGCQESFYGDGTVVWCAEYLNCFLRKRVPGSLIIVPEGYAFGLIYMPLQVPLQEEASDFSDFKAQVLAQICGIQDSLVKLEEENKTLRERLCVLEGRAQSASCNMPCKFRCCPDDSTPRW